VRLYACLCVTLCVCVCVCQTQQVVVSDSSALVAADIVIEYFLLVF